MGAWGTGPFDNDTAADFLAGLIDAVGRVADTSGGDYEVARMNVELLLASHGTDVLGGPGMVAPLRALMRMRCDFEWLQNWNEPKKIAGALNEQIRRVAERMAACKGCRRSLGKRVAELQLEARNATRAPIPASTRKRKKSRGRRIAKTAKGSK